MAETGTDIQKAKALLESGELVAIPTETVYGLAGNALNNLAIAKIFEVKDRPAFDPLIIHVPDLLRASRYVQEIPEDARKLAKAFWPGPLTLVLPKRPVIPDLVSAGLDTVGIRCPNHILTRGLLEIIDFPLAAPSANPFGYVSPTTASHVNDQLGDKIAYILDGGSCKVGIESTIIGFDGHSPVIYRMGGLSLEEIEDVVGKVRVEQHTSSNPKAPGQLKSHYAPSKKIIAGNIDELLRTHRSKSVGVISFQKKYDLPFHVVLSPTGSLSEAARNLFSALRTLDKMPVDLIVTEWVPDNGIGRAINDRLRRASH